MSSGEIIFEHIKSNCALKIELLKKLLQHGYFHTGYKCILRLSFVQQVAITMEQQESFQGDNHYGRFKGDRGQVQMCGRFKERPLISFF